MWKGILALLQSLPTILGLVERALDAFRKFQKKQKQIKQDKNAEEGRNIKNQIAKAQTSEERKKLLKKYKNLTGRG